MRGSGTQKSSDQSMIMVYLTRPLFLMTAITSLRVHSSMIIYRFPEGGIAGPTFNDAISKSIILASIHSVLTCLSFLTGQAFTACIGIAMSTIAVVTM